MHPIVLNSFRTQCRRFTREKNTNLKPVIRSRSIQREVEAHEGPNRRHHDCYFHIKRKLTFVRRIFCMFVCWAAVFVAGGHAADQSISLQRNNSAAAIESPPGEAVLERFKVVFDQRVDELFTDRFHPFNVMSWNMELADNDSDHLRERAASAGRNALSKSVGDGVREATIDLPILLWLKERQGLLADFLRNSLDSVGEEEVAPLDVSYRFGERSWWQRLSESGAVRYGIRPLSESPYTFLSLGIKDGDALLLLAHVRYHYRHFAEHLFEIALSVPLAHGFAIDLGTSYQFGRRDAEERLVVKLFKELKGGGIVHLGLEAQQHPALFAGIALPW